MCTHEIGTTELYLDRNEGKLRGVIVCDCCKSVIREFNEFHQGMTNITTYRVNPNLHGNSDAFGDSTLNC